MIEKRNVRVKNIAIFIGYTLAVLTHQQTCAFTEYAVIFNLGEVKDVFRLQILREIPLDCREFPFVDDQVTCADEADLEKNSHQIVDEYGNRFLVFDEDRMPFSLINYAWQGSFELKTVKTCRQTIGNYLPLPIEIIEVQGVRVLKIKAGPIDLKSFFYGQLLKYNETIRSQADLDAFLETEKNILVPWNFDLEATEDQKSPSQKLIAKNFTVTLSEDEKTVTVTKIGEEDTYYSGNSNNLAVHILTTPEPEEPKTGGENPGEPEEPKTGGENPESGLNMITIIIICVVVGAVLLIAVTVATIWYFKCRSRVEFPSERNNYFQVPHSAESLPIPADN